MWLPAGSQGGSTGGRIFEAGCDCYHISRMVWCHASQTWTGLKRNEESTVRILSTNPSRMFCMRSIAPHYQRAGAPRRGWLHLNCIS